MLNHIISLIPSYLIFIAIVLVILPTFLTIFLRYALYRHIYFLAKKVRRLILGERELEQPSIIQHLEKRLQQVKKINLEQTNTVAIIEGVYSQEKFSLLGLSLSCEAIDFFSRVIPNLLLAFGLFGTFLGITINLASLSQTITQADISDIRSLVAELNQPLQGMGIAFVTSLIAVGCSAILTVINLMWNTNISKSNLFSYLEDYLDNIYLPLLPQENTVETSINTFANELGGFLEKFSQQIEETVRQSIANPVQQLVAENKRTNIMAQQFYEGLIDSATSIEKGAHSLNKAASTIEDSKFAQKISSATSDLAIAQNQFSQSSLVLKKSTESLEFSLDTVNKSVQKLVTVGEEINQLNQKYMEILAQSKDETTL
jgi:hypothetical protein